MFPNDPFANPVWNALHSTHQHLALTAGLTCKYPSDVAPFAALAENTPAALRDLYSLLHPREATCVLGDPPPPLHGIRHASTIPCLQMAFPKDTNLPIPDNRDGVEIVLLTCADAPAMVALTDIAFPGFFRSRTCIMGSYYGIFNDGRLIAMAGERMIPAPCREISAVCTHPDHRGHGYAPNLIAQLLQDHRNSDAISCLHVASNNQRAIDLYLSLGFQTVREVQAHRIVRID